MTWGGNLRNSVARVRSLLLGESNLLRHPENSATQRLRSSEHSPCCCIGVAKVLIKSLQDLFELGWLNPKIVTITRFMYFTFVYLYCNISCDVILPNKRFSLSLSPFEFFTSGIFAPQDNSLQDISPPGIIHPRIIQPRIFHPRIIHPLGKLTPGIFTPLE